MCIAIILYTLENLTLINIFVVVFICPSFAIQKYVTMVHQHSATLFAQNISCVLTYKSNPQAKDSKVRDRGWELIINQLVAFQ